MLSNVKFLAVMPMHDYRAYSAFKKEGGALDIVVQDAWWSGMFELLKDRTFFGASPIDLDAPVLIWSGGEYVEANTDDALLLLDEELAKFLGNYTIH